MKNVWSVLGLTARAAIWRPTRNLQFVGLPSLLAWIVALAVIRVGFQFLAAGLGGGFNPYGLNAIVAWLALDVAVAALFVQPAARVTALSAMFALSIIAELVIDAVNIATPLAPALTAVWANRAAPIAVFAVVSLWWIGAMTAVLRTFTPRPGISVLGRAAGLWLALLAISAIVPHAPVFVPRDFNIDNANWWEILHARPLAQRQEGGGSGEAEAAPFSQAQRALLQAQFDGLAPSTKGATAVYAIGISGWSEDVFLKELDGGLAAMGGVLPIRGRTLRLVNHRETLQNLPLADGRNFAAAVHAIGKVMNKDDDVLLLLMTSHGELTGFGLRLPNGAISELTPQHVAAALNNEGIKNRIVIVSACYAGTFVPPLANDDTIVVTAADAKNTSFGCAPERDWTYFGDAFFRQSVRPGRDLQHTFESARVLIQGWELMDRAQPSNPQAHFGPALVAKLSPFFASPPNAGQ
ncbi:MAG: C13 family peptidase [Xanthobacteraceae bacterium]|nr:C13 family peptidase [Xanthobacteraceae bacterium]